MPQIQTFALQGLSDILQDFGIEPSEFLAQYNLRVKDLEQKNTYISYRAYVMMLQDAGDTCQAPHLGVLLSYARSHSIASKGVIGMLLKLCDTVGEVLEAIIKYYNLLSEGAHYELMVDKERAWFVRRGRIPGLSENRIVQDSSLCDFLNVFRNTVAEDWQPEKIFFSYPAPEDYGPYEDVISCPIVFNSAQQSLQFSKEVLEQKVHITKSVLDELMHDLMARSTPNSHITFRETVSEVIDMLLPTGICGARSIANLLAIHPRTLRRRLQNEGGSFAELLEERRSRLSLFYLRETTLRINQISVALGYGSSEAFTRAFQRWFDQLPSEWRAHYRANKEG